MTLKYSVCKIVHIKIDYVFASIENSLDALFNFCCALKQRASKSLHSKLDYVFVIIESSKIISFQIPLLILSIFPQTKAVREKNVYKAS